METLKLILKGGFWPRYCLEDVKWVGVDGIDFVAFPMVCFCDIPLSRVDEHIDFYGSFGIGLTREWAMKNGLTPIHYVSHNSKIPFAYKSLDSFVTEHIKEEKREEGWKLLRCLLAHTKPIEGRMVVSGKTINKEFHQESEWRYIASEEKIEDILTEDQYLDTNNLTEKNNASKLHGLLNFSLNEIKYIFVENDSDIPNIINFIQVELDHHPSVEVKVLLSRVVSIESIKRDL